MSNSDDLAEQDEIQEDDITTQDHCLFYQYGKPILNLNIEDDHVEALRTYMENEGFWTNVWWISDHGNAHLIDMGGEDE